MKIKVREARHCEAFSPKTVAIGDQVWMAENLAIDDGKGGIYYNEENSEYYYTWRAAMRVAKSIPGWHLPTAKEWNKAASADAQELKSKLGVKLAGYWGGDSFNYVDDYANFWTATEYSPTSAYSRYFSTGASVGSSNDDKTNYAYSVRLVKD